MGGLGGVTRRCATWHTLPRPDRRQPIEQSQKIAQRTPAIGVVPPAPAMLGRVVDHVAALAERGEIARRIVGRVVIEVRAGDIHPREPDDRGDVCPDDTDAPSPPVAPLSAIGIPPATIAKMEDARTVRPSAMLAAAFSAAEPDQPGQLGPVARVQPAMFRHDRHDDSMSQGRAERKRKITVRTAGGTSLAPALPILS